MTTVSTWLVNSSIFFLSRECPTARNLQSFLLPDFEVDDISPFWPPELLRFTVSLPFSLLIAFNIGAGDLSIFSVGQCSRFVLFVKGFIVGSPISIAKSGGRGVLPLVLKISAIAGCTVNLVGNVLTTLPRLPSGRRQL